MSQQKSILFLLFLAFLGQAIAQKSGVDKNTYTYKDTLKLDFYLRSHPGDQPAPLLVLLHGGGFANGMRDGKNETEFSRTMAQKGYAVASISYHLTRKNDPFNCDCSTEKKMATFVSAAEDLSDAIHFLSEKKELVFDRNKIILIGSSAGAEAILHAAFMSHHYRFSHIPGFPISGVISFSGAISNGSYISKSNAVPSLFIHGKKDELVPYGTAPHHFCDENRAGYLMLDGPETLSEKLKETNTSYILAFDPEGKHNWANKAYKEIDLVAYFIQNLVLEKKFIQSRMELDVVENEKKLKPGQE